MSCTISIEPWWSGFYLFSSVFFCVPEFTSIHLFERKKIKIHWMKFIKQHTFSECNSRCVNYLKFNEHKRSRERKTHNKIKRLTNAVSLLKLNTNWMIATDFTMNVQLAILAAKGRCSAKSLKWLGINFECDWKQWMWGVLLCNMNFSSFAFIDRHRQIRDSDIHSKITFSEGRRKQ